MDKSRGFGSRLGYILSLAGFCVGIGNIWKFPYLVAMHGGGAFLIIYLLFVIIAGIPLFLIENTLGRSSGASPIVAMRRLEGKEKTLWSAIGWIGGATLFIISSYTIMVIGGWTFGYIGKIASGSLKGMDSAQLGATFGAFCGSWKAVLLSILICVFCYLALSGGVKSGVEKICKIMMPSLVIVMIGLAIYTNSLPGAFEGLKYYLVPDFSKVTFATIQAAATQVFYSIGIGMAVGFVFGSYAQPDGSLVSDVTLAAIMDSCIATLAGLVITPALFAFNVDVTAGPPLIFIALPQIFNAIGGVGGQIFGVLFMIMLFFAGFTSMVGGVEALIAMLIDTFKLQRKTANRIIVVAEFLLSIVMIRSQGSGFLGSVRIMGMDIFSFSDFLTASFGLTIGSILMLGYVLFKWGFKKFSEEANRGSTGRLRVQPWMKPVFLVVEPILLLFIVFCIVASYF